MKLVYKEKDTVIIDLGDYSGSFGVIHTGRIYCSKGSIPEEIRKKLKISEYCDIDDTYDHAFSGICKVLSSGRYPVFLRFTEIQKLYVNMYLLLYMLGLSDQEAQDYTLEIVRLMDQKPSLVQSIRSMYYTYSGSDDVYKKTLDTLIREFHQSYAYPEKFYVSVCDLNAQSLKELRAMYTGNDPAMSALSGDGRKRIHCIIRGKVQGVGFRSFAVSHASEYGLTGSVDNLYDGSVELYAQGKADDLRRYLGTIRKGNRFIRVKQIDVEETEVIPGETSFSYLSRY